MDQRAKQRERKARQLDRERRGVVLVPVEVDQYALAALAQYEPELMRLEGKALRIALSEAVTAWLENLGLRYEEAENAADDISY